MKKSILIASVCVLFVLALAVWAKTEKTSVSLDENTNIETGDSEIRDNETEGYESHEGETGSHSMAKHESYEAEKGSSFMAESENSEADTDGDGVNDTVEIESGLSPELGDTDGEGTPDGEEIITVTRRYGGNGGNSYPSAVITLKAANANNITIERGTMENIPGALDVDYDFHVDGEIVEAFLTYKFSEEYDAPTDDFEPGIYHLDPETGEYTLVEEESIDWENHTITVRVTDLSE